MPNIRFILACFVVLLCMGSPAAKVIVVPIDSRPVTGQFPQLIGRIAGIEVVLPPESMLGNYTRPGMPDAVGNWLLAQDYSGVVAVIVAADMIAYGGLIESRIPSVSVETAIRRLEVIRTLRARNPSLSVFAYCALMRTAPTATPETRAWRTQMARYAELEEKYQRTRESHLPERLRELKAEIPPREFARYYEARARNMEIYKALIRMVKDHTISYLIIGADDSQEFGPHYRETKELRAYVREREIDGLVYICDGVDQHAMVLLSRALMRHYNIMPRVHFVLSDEEAGDRPANYESLPLLISVRDQIIASGARPTDNPAASDYVLYLNTRGVDDFKFGIFREMLTQALDTGKPIAVADINFDRSGVGDARLIEAIWQQKHIEDMLAFAAWNTAGNTLGTAIPHANIYLLAKQINKNAFERELRQREFLFHRLVNDYAYCRVIRPAANAMAESHPEGSREESTGAALKMLQDWVSTNTVKVIERYFNNYYAGHTFKAGERDYEIKAIRNIKAWLPWPRAFEVRIEFELVAEPIERDRDR
jgi:hypothetical protein